MQKIEQQMEKANEQRGVRVGVGDQAAIVRT
jgi:hypothetical protein